MTQFKKITDDVHNELIEIFDNNLSKFDDHVWNTRAPMLKELYNINDEKHIQTLRMEIKDPSVRAKIRSIVNLFDGIDNVDGFMNFCRGYLPIAMHTDVCVNPDETVEDGYTIMIPLTVDKRIQTIVWQERMGYPVFDEWADTIHWNNRVKLNNLSEKYNLSNGHWPKPDIVDYMALDDVCQWSKGNAWCFKRSQIHCSTNFKASGIEYKDYILIQTTNGLYTPEHG